MYDTTYTDTTFANPTRFIDDTDTWNERVAVLDADGTICYLHGNWQWVAGDGIADTDIFRVGNNYLAALDAVFDLDGTSRRAVAQALQSIVHGLRDEVEVEFPSGLYGRWHWFMVRMHAHPARGTRGVLVQQCRLTR